MKPGETKNPGGRPRGSSILAPVLRMLAADRDEETGEGAEALARAKEYLRAVRGEIPNADLVLARHADLIERVDGKPRQTIEHDGSPISFHIGGFVVPPPALPEAEAPRALEP